HCTTQEEDKIGTPNFWSREVLLAGLEFGLCWLVLTTSEPVHRLQVSSWRTYSCVGCSRYRLLRVCEYRLAEELLPPAPGYDWWETKVFLVQFVTALFHSIITYIDIAKKLLIQASALI
ncbi:unnamed protein product, partial [Ectocarpus sp. 8 AP-2014]